MNGQQSLCTAMASLQYFFCGNYDLIQLHRQIIHQYDGISMRNWLKSSPPVQWKWHDILLFQLFGPVLFSAHVYGSSWRRSLADLNHVTASYTNINIFKFYNQIFDVKNSSWTSACLLWVENWDPFGDESVPRCFVSKSGCYWTTVNSSLVGWSGELFNSGGWDFLEK